MNGAMGVTLVLGALAAAGAVDLAAQDEAGDRRRGRRGPSVEAIMQMRERLELTEEQIADLDLIRREAVERRSAEATELAELRSRLAAGQIERSEMMAWMEERRDASEGVADERRARIDGVLTEDQLASLAEMRGRPGAFARGRMGIRGGGGFRGPRGFRGARGGLGRGGPAFRGPRRGIRGGRFDDRFRPRFEGRRRPFREAPGARRGP